ncbi:hypothetical protein FMEXI_12545 [Fusarium mexicanum]|uniref:Uncharacterized protein n=1 Tax=Fusarium mexicanum TaxID=751941 RepID=A0A8H5I9Z6_9HYPO|nr:hypothetical protein FMEXI_12545 [Fusarium mexicanum]
MIGFFKRSPRTLLHQIRTSDSLDIPAKICIYPFSSITCLLCQSPLHRIVLPSLSASITHGTTPKVAVGLFDLPLGLHCVWKRGQSGPEDGCLGDLTSIRNYGSCQDLLTSKNSACYSSHAYSSLRTSIPAPLTLLVKDLRADMILRCPQFLSFIVNPSALTHSHSVQGMADELFSCRNTHDASITFVAAVYMLQYPDTYTRMLDFRHTALTKLRSSLLRPKLSEMPDDVLWALIISMTLLALSDLFGTGDADAAFSHCSALLQIINHINSRSTSRMMTRMPLLSRLAAETALFGTSTLAIFQEWPNCRMGLGQWQRLENLYRRDSDYAFHDVNTSPLLRSRADLFLILLQLVELSRVPESIERSDRLSIIERQLSTLKQDNLRRYGCKEDIQIADIWGMIWGNVISVLRIFLTSLQNLSNCSRSPQISKQVKAALPILKGIWVLQNDKSIAWQLPFAALDVGIIRNVGVLTLLLLVICAVDDMEDLDQVVRRLCQGKEFVSEDHFERLRKVTEIIRSRKTSYNGTCNGNSTEPCIGEHDGLDLLQLQYGPLQGIFNNIQ